MIICEECGYEIEYSVCTEVDLCEECERSLREFENEMAVEQYMADIEMREIEAMQDHIRDEQAMGL